jgi:endoglucanase
MAAAGLSRAAISEPADVTGQRDGLLAGVNLAGADFGKLPGIYGREYLYPAHKHVDYYGQLGFRLIRLPFKWERLQPELYEPFAPGEAALLIDLVRYATGTGLNVILDPHNYAKRRTARDSWSAEHRIGSDAVPTASFHDFWSRLATFFRNDERVMFGLMNEPVGVGAGAWLDIANSTIAAIRAAGAANLILVPGVEYSGAHSWFRAGNTVLAEVVDPAEHFAFDVHQYFDRNSSGTRPEAVSGTIGSERIEAFQTWAREHGFKAILGEFNGGRNPASYNALHDLCQEMSANQDVWLGWAAWAGGPRWPEKEMFNLEPWADGRTREQTALLAGYARPQSPDFWVAPGAVIDLDIARNRVFGSDSFAVALARPDVAERAAHGGKGLWFAARETSAASAEGSLPYGAVTLRGPLLDLLQRPAFTLVMQVRALPSEPRDCTLLSVDDDVLLRRSRDGALECTLGLRTDAQALGHWRAKRRVAIAFDRETGRVAIGATGANCVQAEAKLLRVLHAAIGGAGAAALDGYVARVTGYPEFLDASALAPLLA